MREIVKQALCKTQIHSGSWFVPVQDVKEKALRTALGNFEKLNRESVVAFMDTTLLNSGKAGFLLCEDGLYSTYFRNMPNGCLPFAGLLAATSAPRKKDHIKVLFSDGTSVEVYVNIFAERLCALLENLVALRVAAQQREQAVPKGEESPLQELSDAVAEPGVEVPAALDAETAELPVSKLYRQGMDCMDAGEFGQAASLFYCAAQQAHRPAQYSLGLCYEQGKGVAQNDAEAVRWYQKSAERGYIDAQLSLGVCYIQGRGVAQDEKAGIRWLKRAAVNGSVKGKRYLKALERGEELPGIKPAEQASAQTIPEPAPVPEPAPEKPTTSPVVKTFIMDLSVKVLLDAAQQGDAIAQEKLGMSFIRGRGVTRDLEQGRIWLKKAADQGNSKAAMELDMVSGDDALSSGGGTPPQKAYQPTPDVPPVIAADMDEDTRNLLVDAQNGDAIAQEKLGMRFIRGSGVTRDWTQGKIWLKKAADQGNRKAAMELDMLSD